MQDHEACGDKEDRPMPVRHEAGHFLPFASCSDEKTMHRRRHHEDFEPQHEKRRVHRHEGEERTAKGSAQSGHPKAEARPRAVPDHHSRSHHQGTDEKGQARPIDPYEILDPERGCEGVSLDKLNALKAGTLDPRATKALNQGHPKSQFRNHQQGKNEAQPGPFLLA
jgi:hypothetical protein